MTVPHYGKRNLGAGTAASPGDTLHFNFNGYNDSGDSEAVSGFAVTDIEVFKDGAATARATDSGYSLISDTGQMGDRVGLYRFRIQLFNTADDASFYANGSWYQVAVDSVTIDGKTVRAWVGSFEIGEPRANVVQIDGDTGSADVLAKATNGEGGVSFSAGINMNSSSDTGLNQRLSQIQSDVDTGLRTHISDVDTGLHDTIADLDTGLRGILLTTGVNLGLIRGDTGGADRFYRYTQKLDTGGDATVSASVDTGQVNQAVWQTNAQRKLTVDTGIADQVWKTTTAGYNDDTGTFGELLRNPATATVDTGQVNQAVWQGNATRVLTANTNLANLAVNVTQLDSDTGFADRLGKFASVLSDAGQIDTGTGVADTGSLNQTVWQANAVRGITAISDTGMNERFSRIQSDVDTGLRTHINDLDTGLHDTLSDYDTGLRGILITTGVNLGRIRGDTGGADRFYRYTQKLDTGGDATVSASVDTGQVNQAVWQANAQRKLTVDTGIADQVWKQPTAAYADDTGTFGELLRVAISSSASVDTGQINQAVWQGNAARSITNVGDTGIVNSLQIIRFDVDTGLRTHISDVDTGLHDTLADYDTGIRALLALRDTGAIANAVWNFSSRPVTNVTGFSDTGVNARLGAIQTKTDSLTFTVAGQVDANIQYVNDVQVAGTGDTGAPDTWRPA